MTANLRSPLATHIQAFLAHKRALGKGLHKQELMFEGSTATSSSMVSFRSMPSRQRYSMASCVLVRGFRPAATTNFSARYDGCLIGSCGRRCLRRHRCQHHPGECLHGAVHFC